MAPMTAAGANDSTAPPPPDDDDRRPGAVRIALLWAGAVACVAGLALHRTWEHWRPGRFAELLLIALLAAALALCLRKLRGASWASCLGLVFAAALLPFAGPLPVAATVLFALACVALGGWVAGRMPLALQCACGLVLMGGALGWLLPLPLHSRWTYLALCVAAIALRRRQLRDSLRDARIAWSAAVSGHPRAAAWAVLALGLASTACWLPTLQVDDLGYHLRLPWELQLRGAYAPDPWRHAWAVAPWASDVQHAMVQLLAGGEARGALNALWIAITAAAAWHLARALGGSARTGWICVALYASLPMTAALAAGMQTETAAAALLAWLAWLVQAREMPAGGRRVLAAGLLTGGLAGLKLIGALQAAILLAWAAWRWRASPAGRQVALAVPLAVAVAGSSYAYGAVLAGNPFLPLFNAWFESPYFATTHFQDARWHAGWTPWLPWSLTFATGDYHEGFAGAAGFAMGALGGAWLLAFVQPRTRALAIAATLMLFATLLVLQYLRYAFPALVLLLPCMAVAAQGAGGKAATRLLAAVCVLGLAFQANAHWMLRTGALKQAVLALGDDRPLFDAYAPERSLLADARVRRLAVLDGNVLAFDGDKPWVAEAGTRGRMLAWYDPGLQQAALAADSDPSGAAWSRMLRDLHATGVLVRDQTLTPARRAALQDLGARKLASAGAASLWQLPGGPGA